MEQSRILTRLLAKYEKSKHMLAPGQSNRRVMLQIEKKELPRIPISERCSTGCI